MNDTATIMKPPAICGLELEYDSGGYAGAPTEEFWGWYNQCRVEMKHLGFGVRKDDDGAWHVLWCEKWVRTGAIDETVGKVRAAVEREQQVRKAQNDRLLAEAARRKADTERRYETEQRMAEQDRAWVEATQATRVEAARATALANLTRWGEAVVKGRRLVELLDIDRLRLAELVEIESLNKLTTKKVEEREAKARSLTAGVGVDWSADTVVAGIKALTQADQDRAQHRNDIGWSKADSSNGHFCYGMLEEDRELAVKMGRSIIGPYARQLVEKHGLELV